MTRSTDSSPKIGILQALGADRLEDPGDPLGEVVAACKTGDRNAQRRLYDACHRKVFRLVVRMVGQQDADDVTQQVFLQVFRRLDQFSGHARFETWLHRLAVNECLQQHRRSRRSTLQGLEEETPDKTLGHDVRSENKEVLERALQQVGPELRSIFLLREVEKLSYNEIALALDVPEGTVGSRLNRARRELQRHLGELLAS